MKKILRFLCCAVFLLTAAAGISAGEWPAKTITIICPMPPGGGIDSLTRSVVAPALEKALNTKVMVKNVTGAAGTSGTAEAATAKADGYTLLATPLGPLVIQPFVRDLPYRQDSFVPFYFIADTPYFLLTPKSSPYSTFQQFIDYVKTHPDEVAYGSVGPGSVPHMNMAALCKLYDLKMTHIPDRGGAEVQKSMATGAVQVACDMGLFIPRFDNKGLIVFSDERQVDFADVPSAKELGVPLRFSVWNALWAPKGTPDAVMQKVHDALAGIDADPKAQQILKSLGAYGKQMSIGELQDFVKVETIKFKQLVEELGLKEK